MAFTAHPRPTFRTTKCPEDVYPCDAVMLTDRKCL